LGFIVFDAEPADVRPEMVFDTLQIQLGTALKGVLLRQDLKKALQDAEDANRHKSGFLSMVSHELRTPLNLIVGLSEMALREYARAEGGSTENLKKFAEQIYTSGQHLDRLIRDVLDLASSQMGKMDIICSEVDVVELLSEASAMGRQLAEQKRLQFRVDIPLRLPPVWGDRTRLRQVLLNLLSNAVKFTARGEIALSASLGVDGILIAVRDTGLGVPLKEQVTIFNEFHQSERTTARGYGGIGLGLAITRRLVELHAGRIWLESSGIEGEGTAFFITLPITTIPGKFKKEADPWQKSTVLIIANEECASETLLQHLQLQGFLVEELVLKDSPDYLSYLKLHPPAAIVLDMAPSAEQGWEIMRLLKEHPDTRDIPVLFYALMSEQDSGAVLELDTLQKPVSASALIQVLEQRGLRGGQADPAVTLLIVDDEPGILEIHSQMAQEALPSARLITAQNGRQALERMRQTKPDLVLLDLMMPEMDGFGVLRAMQEDKDTQGIPVIILSAQTLTERELSLLNRSVAAILGKGLFTSAETLQQIEAVLSRSKRLGSESQRLVRQAMVFIHKHYPEHILRGDIAGFLNVNEQYLSRCFNREIGLSPMVYLNRFRILQAKRMLEHGEYSITKIALAVGFSNQSYFSRMFLREVGMSPRAYQRRWG
jgi:signal transduction histidine kinase/AraC-like DNA-binding protein/FixJ family two-component response regulator